MNKYVYVGCLSRDTSPIISQCKLLYRYRESIINKIFRRITNNHTLSQSQQLTKARDIQEEEIRISINLPYVEGKSEKLRRILRSYKIRSIFYFEMTLRILLCKPKD